MLYAWRDSAGNPLSMQDWNGTTAYTYDNNSRVTAAGSASYGYDWVGNRTSPNGLLYNAADQLYSWPGQHQYTYLGTGSLEYQKDSSGTNIQKTYTYTAANLLSSVTHAGVNDASEMTWDADGNRVSFTSSEGTGTWEYMYDTTAGIPAVIGEVWPDDFWAGYIREPNGALIASAMYPGSSPVYHYYHFDALGSTRLITDDSGTVTDTYSYDAWGNTTHDTGSLVQPYQYVARWGYYTHYQDENLPMLELGVRFYDAALGRFTQVDPIPSVRSSVYPYADDLPTFRIDPSGKSALWVLPAIAFGTGYAAGCLKKSYDDSEDLMKRLADWGLFGGDKLAHCYFGCKAVRCVLHIRPLARCILNTMDGLHGKPGSPDYGAHAKYNHAGYGFGWEEGDCFDKCVKFWKDNGRGN